MMEVCGCGTPKKDHHPSLHYSIKRDALMKEVGRFMSKVYPSHIFGDSFNRTQVELVAACFTLARKSDR